MHEDEVSNFNFDGVLEPPQNYAWKDVVRHSNACEMLARRLANVLCSEPRAIDERGIGLDREIVGVGEMAAHTGVIGQGCNDRAVPECEDLQLPIRCRDGGKLIAPPDRSDGSNGEALLDQGGGQEAVAK